MLLSIEEYDKLNVFDKSGKCPLCGESGAGD